MRRPSVRLAIGTEAPRSEGKVHSSEIVSARQFRDRVATIAWNGYRHLELRSDVSGEGDEWFASAHFRLPEGDKEESRAIMKALLNDLRLRDRRDLLKDILENSVPITLQDVVIVFATVSGLRDGQLVQ